MSNDEAAGGSGHPIIVAVARLDADLASLIGAPTWSMTTVQTRDALIALTHVANRLAELDLRVLDHARATQAGEDAGATCAATWLAHATRQTRLATFGKAKFAQTVGSHPLTQAAMGAGEVLPDQARVILDAVDALPETVSDGLRVQAETYLLGEAANYDAKDLKVLGRKVLAVIAPDVGEAHEAKLLDDEEAAAKAATRFAMSEDGHGTVHGRFTIPIAQAAMLRKALLGFAAPKHQRVTNGAGTYVPGRPSPERLGEAFCELIERYPTEHLPNAGGVNATVVVTMTLETLLGGLKAASLDTGDTISASQARRLACEAGIIPMVLDGRGRVLDVGRKHRFHTPIQRLALIVEQKHCQATGCDTPASLCHVHHTTPWARGGHTNLATAQLLCPRHHHRVHQDQRNQPSRT